jgi:hypothetical protein
VRGLHEFRGRKEYDTGKPSEPRESEFSNSVKVVYLYILNVTRFAGGEKWDSDALSNNEIVGVLEKQIHDRMEMPYPDQGGLRLTRPSIPYLIIERWDRQQEHRSDSPYHHNGQEFPEALTEKWSGPLPCSQGRAREKNRYRVNRSKHKSDGDSRL